MNMKRWVAGGGLVTVILVAVFLGGWGRGGWRGGQELPPLPVRVDFRESRVGLGRVLVMSNETPRYLRLKLSVQNPTFGSNQTFAVDAPGRRELTFGWQEGWSFASGDRIRLEQSEYRKLELEVP